MAGLLDFLESPAGLGLISAAAGGMAGARRGTPWNNAGRGLLAGVAGYGNALERQRDQAQLDLQAQDRAQMNELRGLQMEQARTQMEREKAAQEWKAGLPGVMSQAQGQTVAGNDAIGDGVWGGLLSTPGNPQAVRDYLLRPESPGADDILKQQFFPKPAEPFTLKPGEARYGADGKVVAQIPEKVDFNQLMIPDGKGGYMINQAYFDAKSELARAGRPQVSVTNKVENKASDSVASQVGPILDKSLTAAEGATRVLDAANRVTAALDSGKVITGPLANARVTAAQIGQMFGVGGANDQEILLNTRRVIRGLSEMTLQGRKEMSGQGAITDRESALAEKATSGDISDLTAGEIRELAAASIRASQYQIEKHRSRVKNAGALPGMQNITPFFEVPEMQMQPQQAAPAAGAPTMRYNPQTGKVEQVR